MFLGGVFFGFCSVHRRSTKMGVSTRFLLYRFCEYARACACDMHLEYIHDDLLNTTAPVIVHCVSGDLAMGAGVALQLRRKFGRPCVGTTARVGSVIVQCTSDTEETQRIMHLVTKEKYYGKPTLESLRAALDALREQCSLLQVKLLAMPKIGCGLDRLQWDDVQRCITECFLGVDIRVLVYVLE